MADRRRRKAVLKKLKNAKIFQSETEEEAQNCIICFDKVSCRGKLSVCEHWFCFPCILEWSKNTNTCPVCKAKFRCISKTHLIPGKSPIQKVRVPDVDQRVHQDDEDFIWAEIESLSENDFSDYAPPNDDDTQDETFHTSLPLHMIIEYADDSGTDVNETSETVSSDSSTYESISYDSDEMSSTSSEFDTDWSPIVIKKKKSSRAVISDGKDSESRGSDDEQAQDECLRNGNDRSRKSKGKGTTKSGFHSRPKPRKLSNEKFEVELQRRSETKEHQKRTTASKKKTNCQQKSRTTREESSSNVGRWLNVASTSSQTSSSARSYSTQDLTRKRRNGTAAITTTTRNRFRNEDNCATEEVYCLTYDPINARRNQTSSTSNERGTQPNKHRNVENLVKVGVTYESTRNKSRPTQSVLPKKRSHKRLTYKFESDSESCSDESQTSLVQPPKRSNVSEFSRHTTTTKRSENRQRDKRPSRVLKEVQNFFDDMES